MIDSSGRATSLPLGDDSVSALTSFVFLSHDFMTVDFAHIKDEEACVNNALGLRNVSQSVNFNISEDDHRRRHDEGAGQTGERQKQSLKG